MAETPEKMGEGIPSIKPKEFRIKGMVYIRCFICQRKYRKSYMEEHIRVHTTEKPFKCSHSPCSKVFGHQQDCKRHMTRCSYSKIGGPVPIKMTPPEIMESQIPPLHNSETESSDSNSGLPYSGDADTEEIKNRNNFEPLPPLRPDQFRISAKTMHNLVNRRPVVRVVRLERRKVKNGGQIHKPVDLQAAYNKMYSSLFKKNCYFCKAEVSAGRGMVKHLRNHTRESPFQCSYCGEEFQRGDYLSRHQSRHEEVHREFKSKCDQCDRFFKTDEQLQRHSTIHWRISSIFSIPEQSHGAEDCQIKTESKCVKEEEEEWVVAPISEVDVCVSDNVQMEGQENRPLEFEPDSNERFEINREEIKLNTRFKSNTSVIRSFASHSKIHIRKRPFKCGTCGFAFKRMYHLKQHLRIRSGGRPFKCETCGKDFCTNSNLIRHTRLLHTLEKTFKCEICGKCFFSNYAITRHSLIHSREQPSTTTAIGGEEFNSNFDFNQRPNLQARERTFKCITCGKGFFTHRAVNRHSKIHSREQVKTAICENLFPSNDGLTKHRKIRIRERTFKCQTCDKGFFTNYDAKRHSMIHSREPQFKTATFGNILACTLNSGLKSHNDSGFRTWERRFKCETCGKSFFTSYDLKRHSMIHSREQQYKTAIGGNVLTPSSSLHKPSGVHIMERTFKCEICRKGFFTNRALKRHSKIHSREQVKMATCENQLTSNSVASTNSNSVTDQYLMVNDHIREKPIFQCKTCGKRVIKKSQAIVHYRIHSGERPFCCAICGKGFIANYVLNRHSKIHSGDRKTAFNCETCGQGFMTSHHLRRHSLIHSGYRETFECEICRKGFFTNHDLKRHSKIHAREQVKTTTYENLFTSNSVTNQHPRVKVHIREKTGNRQGIEHSRIHSGERPFCCTTCGKGFISNSARNIHSKIHSGGRKRAFKCETCGQGFMTSHHLRRHSLIHTGERPFNCNICGQDFSRKGHLKRHSFIHTEERPFKCEICDKRYYDKSYLKRHVDSNHHASLSNQVPAVNLEQCNTLII